MGAEVIRRWLTATGDPCLMVNVRLIPCLDIRNGRVVKSIRFQQLRDAGILLRRQLSTRSKGPMR